MSEIGTHKQEVKQEVFNQHFEETFKLARLKSRPGKTVYVFRNVELKRGQNGYNTEDLLYGTVKEKAT